MKILLGMIATLFVFSTVVRADTQEIAPGKGLQSAVVVDTGANGICETTATPDDIQVIPVGTAPSFQAEIRCGPNKVADTTAAGDDTQLVAVGASCNNPNVAVVDTGANGIADTTAVTDDVQLIPVGTAPANRPCVITGPNGKRDTAGPAAGDDVLNLLLPSVGSALPNQPVIRCGPNKLAETNQNNFILAGDDVQLVTVGNTCPNQNTVVVDSGANGIAETRAEGPDLVLKVKGPVRVAIPKGKATKSKTIGVTVANVEFGAAAPASRTYTLVVTDGSCPNGTVSQVDADARASAPGLQTTGSVPKGGKLSGRFVVTFHIEDITSSAANIPYRCAVKVEADVVDPALNGAPDDAANSENNSTPVDFEVVDHNDLP
jgi:hypothetical protein